MIKFLHKEMDKEQNSSKSVREIGRKLDKQAEILDGTNTKGWLEQQRAKKEQSCTIEVQTDATVSGNQRPRMVDNSTQADDVELEKETVVKEKTERIKNRLRNMNAKNDVELQQIINMERPEQTFEYARAEVGSPANIEGNFAIYTDGREMERGLNRRLGERFPELKTLLKDANEQEIGAIDVTTSVRVGENKKSVEKVLYKVVPKVKLDDINRISVYLDLMIKVGNMAVDEEVNTLYTSTPEGMSPTETWKLLECVARSTGTVLCIAAKNRQRGTKNGSRRKDQS